MIIGKVMYASNKTVPLTANPNVRKLAILNCMILERNVSQWKRIRKAYAAKIQMNYLNTCLQVNQPIIRTLTSKFYKFISQMDWK